MNPELVSHIVSKTVRRAMVGWVAAYEIQLVDRVTGFESGVVTIERYGNRKSEVEKACRQFESSLGNPKICREVRDH